MVDDVLYTGHLRAAMKRSAIRQAGALRLASLVDAAGASCRSRAVVGATKT